MGADIHSFAEVKIDNKWVKVTDPKFDSYREEKTTEPFRWRSYSVFGFLADVRNYSFCTPICEPKGLPDDSKYLNSISPYAYAINPMSGEVISENERQTVKEDIVGDGDYHSMSWLTLKELLDFDYEQELWDRRVTKGSNGAALAKEGEGQIITYREYLGEDFFKEIEVLKTLGNPDEVRVVFWFDN